MQQKWKFSRGEQLDLLSCYILAGLDQEGNTRQDFLSAKLQVKHEINLLVCTEISTNYISTVVWQQVKGYWLAVHVKQVIII